MTRDFNYAATAETLGNLADDALAACEARGWRTDWSARGCYLHLEVSELIEACRGKGDSSKEEEAADVLLVLLSLCASYQVNLTGALAILRQKLDGIRAGKIGAGPESP